jgi:hypothetical protein
LNQNTRNMIIGVALGAIAGALVGLFYTRARPAEGSGAKAEQEDLGVPQILRLGLLVLGTVREILGMA